MTGPRAGTTGFGTTSSEQKWPFAMRSQTRIPALTSCALAEPAVKSEGLILGEHGRKVRELETKLEAATGTVLTSRDVRAATADLFVVYRRA